MNELTCAFLKSVSGYALTGRALRRAALGAVTALALLQPALAETKADEKVSHGTPDDLPITLSGSYLAGLLAGGELDFASAAAFFQETLSVDPDNNQLLERAFVLRLANGDLDEAISLAEEMDRVGAGNFLSKLTRGSDDILNGEYERALLVMPQSQAGPVAEILTGVARAWALQGAGRTDEALKTLEDLQGPDWYKVFKATHASLILYASGDVPGALTEIEKAYEEDRGAVRVVDAYARLLVQSGRQDEALKVIDEYDKLLNGHPLLTATRERIEKGETLPPLVTSPAAGFAEILYGLGSAIGRDGAEELSTAMLQLSLHLDPKAEFAAVALGSLFERMKQPDRAIEALKKVPENSPLKREAEIQIGLNYNSMEKVDEAQAHLQKLIDADPNEQEAVISLGNVLRTHKRFEEAEKVYTEGISRISDISQEHWLLFYFRGICRERLKEWEGAEADLRRALELYPDQPLVLNYLGYSLVDRGMKLDEALGMIQKAVDLRPTDGYIVDSLGWVYYRLGRFDEAVTELERAIELRPADPVINDHLGDAYWQVGRRLEARFQWNHARDLGPEPEELPKILDKIENGLPETPVTDEAKADAKKNGG